MLLSAYPSQRYGGWARELARIFNWPAPSPFWLTRGPVATFWWLGSLRSVPVCQPLCQCYDEGEGRPDETLFHVVSGCHKVSLRLKEEQNSGACKRLCAFQSEHVLGWTIELVHAYQWPASSRLGLARGLVVTFWWLSEDVEIYSNAG